MESNLEGHDSHGVVRIPEYVERMEQKLIHGGAQIQVVHETEAFAVSHSGRDIGCLAPLQTREYVLVTATGASGGFDADGTPTTYRRAMEHIRDGKIDAESLVSHRYRHLSQMQQAFSEDSKQQDYIKGMLLRGGTS